MSDQCDRPKSTRPARPPQGRKTTDWRAKLDPFFIKMAEQQKKIDQLSKGSEEDRKESQRLIRNPPPEMIAEAHRVRDEFRALGKKITFDLGAIFTIDDRFPAAPGMSDENYMLAWIAWNRYKKTFKQLQEEDIAGVRESSKRVVIVHRDYQQWRYGELDPQKMNFKMDREHQTLVHCGWDLGIESLSPEELADCFDELCSCGKPQVPENLRKFRTRVIQFLKAAGAAPSVPISMRQNPRP